LQLVSSMKIGVIGVLGCSAIFATGQTMAPLPASVLPVLAHSRVTGAPSSSQVVYLTVSLKPRYPSELQAFVDAASNPRSPAFHQWLTPAQVGQQFGASPSTVSAVVSYLKSKGLKINLQAPDNMAILAQGTVAQVQKAFSTTLKTYSGTDLQGSTIAFRANSTPLEVPSAWAPQVQAVTGVENYTRPYPCATTQTLTPPLARTLYGLTNSFGSGSRGQGRTVAYSNWVGYRLSNIPLFVNAFHLPVPSGGAGSNIQVVTLNGGAGSGPENAEGDLDMQMELSAAPLATILIYDDGAGDLVGTLTKEASDNRADLISESYGWGLPSSYAVAAHNEHLAMNAQGQTYMAASGDGGTGWAQGLPYPDADPEVLIVGGTIATVDSITGSRVNEVDWSGSGGGWTVSGYPFDKRPSWQVGNGIPPANQPNARLLPDVSLQAGGPGAFAMYYGGGEIVVDGTSCSSPYTAGGLAVVEQQLEAAGITARQGRIMDLIYAQNGRSDVWYDITAGDSNGTLPNGSTSNATPGWDTITGWGTPNFDALYNGFLQQIALTPYPPTLLINPPSSEPPLVGTWLFGDVTSVAASDGITYQLASQAIAQFGEAASFGAQFFVPTDSFALQIDLEANSDGPSGGPNMVWLYNWNTGNYDLIGSAPLAASGSDDELFKVRAADVGNYIGPSGEVDAVVRGHFPIKPLQNQLPAPFTYRVDYVQALAH